jgi:hypothetical protein
MRPWSAEDGLVDGATAVAVPREKRAERLRGRRLVAVSQGEAPRRPHLEVPMIPRAIEQLYDELLARSFALNVMTALTVPSPEKLEQDAERMVDNVTAGRIPAAELIRLLHPHRLPAPDDSWWRTPLGQLLGPCGSGPMPDEPRDATSSVLRPSMTSRARCGR